MVVAVGGIGDDALLREQIEYYRERAPEYDEWVRREGRYDRGPERNRRWADELDEVRAALDAAGPSGRVLDLACGTGLWTGQLARAADEVVAVDASPEVLAINRARVGSPKVRYEQADLFAWRPDGRFDFAMFGFWISHVPPDRLAAFLGLLDDCLAEGGRCFFVDNLVASDAPQPQTEAERAGPTATRRLNDGRAYQIVKIFYRPEQLAERHTAHGWRSHVRATRTYFVYGTASR